MVYFNISNDHNLDSSTALESKMDKVKNNKNIKDLYNQLDPSKSTDIIKLSDQLTNIELYYLMYFKKLSVILLSDTNGFTYKIS